MLVDGPADGRGEGVVRVPVKWPWKPPGRQATLRAWKGCRSVLVTAYGPPARFLQPAAHVLGLPLGSRSAGRGLRVEGSGSRDRAGLAATAGLQGRGRSAAGCGMSAERARLQLQARGMRGASQDACRARSDSPIAHGATFFESTQNIFFKRQYAIIPIICVLTHCR